MARLAGVLYHTAIGGLLRGSATMSRWTAVIEYTRMLWWLYLWLGGMTLLAMSASNNHMQLFGLDASGFAVVYVVSLLVAGFYLQVLPSLWWLITLPWRLRSRPLATVGVIAAFAVWLNLLLGVMSHVYHATGQLLFGSFSLTSLIGLYRFITYRRDKQAYRTASWDITR